jgi:fumarylacetoacetate (FAA) hydrolase
VKLGSLKSGGRDGELVVVSADLSRATRPADIAPTLQAALDDWDRSAGALRSLYEDLEAGRATGTFPLTAEDLAAPLPRAYQFLDGSAYLAHVERVRRARGAEMPPSFLTDPLMYQAVSDGFLPPVGTIPVASEDYGIDFESEVCVVTDDVPMGVSAEAASGHVKLVCLVNDVSLRNLIPAELGKGFGFLHSKPRSALSPVMVTPDELGDAWRDGRVHLPLCTWLNGELAGDPEAGAEMHFSFYDLIAHITRTRAYTAGTILGSGTISNEDPERGSSCLSEKRMIETIATGTPTTAYLMPDDHVRIEMLDDDGRSLFGAIDQRVVPA